VLVRPTLNYSKFRDLLPPFPDDKMERIRALINMAQGTQGDLLRMGMLGFLLIALVVLALKIMAWTECVCP